MVLTGLSYAAYYGDKKAVESLLAQKVDVNTPEDYFGSSLQAAAFRGHSDITKILIEAGADVNAHGGFHHSNPLVNAAESGNMVIVQQLLSAGASVNYQWANQDRTRFSETALSAAAGRGELEIVSLLIAHGANVHAIVDSCGSRSSVLRAGVYSERKDVVETLLRTGEKEWERGGLASALQDAAYYGSSDIVHLLLNVGADINVPGELHGTALQAAVKGNKPEVLRALLSSSADINASGPRYGDVFEAAVAGYSLECLRVLMEHEKKLTAPLTTYRNAYQKAAEAEVSARKITTYESHRQLPFSYEEQVKIKSVLLARINQLQQNEGSEMVWDTIMT